MKRLLLWVASILAGGTIAILCLYRGPQPKVKMPDPRYNVAIPPAIVHETQDFTVLIANESIDMRYRGSGVLLTPTLVLTCAHMIPDNRSTSTLWIYPFPGERVVKAKLKFIDESKDLALLELTTPVTGHKTPVLAESVIIGEPMLSVGNINGYMLWFASYGIISGEHERWVLSDAMVRHGNSGGPWVNAKGQIIALTDVGWEDDGGVISGGVPVQDLRRFLGEAKKKHLSLGYDLAAK